MAQLVNKRTLKASDLQAIGQLLVEILGGQLVASTQGSALEGKELAHALQEEVRVICVMLLAEQI